MLLGFVGHMRRAPHRCRVGGTVEPIPTDPRRRFRVAHARDGVEEYTERRVMSGHARIDTHQHYLPQFYRDLLDSHGMDAGGWPTPDWSLEAALALMDDLQIATGVVSLSSPGVRFDDDETSRAVARRVNEFVAELVKDRPERFGLFASLPLPDVDGALAEIADAYDELHADGVVLLSNVDGIYLGDRAYEPVWEELNRRSAVVVSSRQKFVMVSSFSLDKGYHRN
ncbi:amidohydrolase family protein [Nocardia aobensis]|uniref:amidohydrolase family protein n=1 Tax=Nocardia aobensis TaxID=257277 RepID=UPI002479494B|nr:amidohydrolase family protein [Nocardia aobensis]